MFYHIRPCHTAATNLLREPKKALFYHAEPHSHSFHCVAWRGKRKLFRSAGTIWPPCDKGEFPEWSNFVLRLGHRGRGDPLRAVYKQAGRVTLVIVLL